jgi:hypothetical protein
VRLGAAFGASIDGAATARYRDPGVLRRIPDDDPAPPIGWTATPALRSLHDDAQHAGRRVRATPGTVRAARTRVTLPEWPPGAACVRFAHRVIH